MYKNFKSSAICYPSKFRSILFDVLILGKICPFARKCRAHPGRKGLIGVWRISIHTSRGRRTRRGTTVFDDDDLELGVTHPRVLKALGAHEGGRVPQHRISARGDDRGQAAIGAVLRRRQLFTVSYVRRSNQCCICMLM